MKNQMNNISYLFCIFFILLLIINLVKIEYMTNSNNNKKQITISIWGEPGKPPLDSDIILSSTFPKTNTHENLFFNSIMISNWSWDTSHNDILQRPIDVYFRSSNCVEKREESVGIIRKIIEENGFNFVLGGRCGGKNYPTNVNIEDGKWNDDCERCKQSKIILSIDNYNDDNIYLSEKLFIPFAYGSIPAYIGNGQKFIKWADINTESYLDRINYSSDQEFAYAIVNLLRNKELLKYMQQNKKGNSNKLNFWFKGPLSIGKNGFPELITYMRKNFDFSHKNVITYKVDYHHMNNNLHYLEEFLSLVFKKPIKKVENNPDILFSFCC